MLEIFSAIQQQQLCIWIIAKHVIQYVSETDKGMNSYIDAACYLCVFLAVYVSVGTFNTNQTHTHGCHVDSLKDKGSLVSAIRAWFAPNAMKSDAFIVITSP